jgi:hypothetical protein
VKEQARSDPNADKCWGGGGGGVGGGVEGWGVGGWCQTNGDNY